MMQPGKSFFHRNSHRAIWIFSSIIIILAVFLGGWIMGLRTQSIHSMFHSHFLHPFLTKAEMQKKLTTLNSEEVFRFKKNEVRLDNYEEPVVLDFGFDPSLQSVAEDLFDQYKPDLGALVAMDASTGRVLAMAGINRAFTEFKGYPALKATYPSASVFKVITATAAIEQKLLHSSSLIPYAGRDHTLYKYQVLKPEVSGWKRSSSLKEAFARSINTVFGRIGVFQLGEKPLRSYADRYGFNAPIPSEFPIEISHSANPNSAYELAEMASGYTQDNVMSPLHGAMIAAAIANDGQMMEPYFLNGAYLKSGETIYRAEPNTFARVMTPETASEVRNLMRETVVKGTSRKSFKGFFRGSYSELDVGGKTGSLMDRSLKGKIDWFVGFAQAHGRKIAVSVVTMHKKYWTVKSSYLARKAFETAFSAKDMAANSSKN